MDPDNNIVEKSRLADYRVTFGSPSGKRVLEDLKQRWLYQDSRPHVAAGNDSGVVWIDGQRHLVSTIVKWAERPVEDNLVKTVEPITQGDPLDGR